MATDPNNPSQRQPTPPEPGYEERDANTKWLFAIITGLILGIIAAEFALRWFHARMEKTPPTTDRWAGSHPGPNPLWTQADVPRLQISPTQDLAAFRAQEDRELTTYGWINRTSGVVRIPIERAMDLLAQRGLPVRPGVGHSRLGPTPLELQQQRTNATQSETVRAR